MSVPPPVEPTTTQPGSPMASAPTPTTTHPGSPMIAADPPSFRLFAVTNNEQSSASVLDQIIARYPAHPSTLTSAQNTLLKDVSSVSTAQSSQLLGALDGQIHADMIAAQPEAGWQLENSVYGHLGDEAGAPDTGRRVW